MALGNGHGNGAGAQRIEVLPPDELPVSVRGPRPSARRSLARRARRREKRTPFAVLILGSVSQPPCPLPRISFHASSTLQLAWT